MSQDVRTDFVPTQEIHQQHPKHCVPAKLIQGGPSSWFGGSNGGGTHKAALFSNCSNVDALSRRKQPSPETRFFPQIIKAETRIATDLWQMRSDYIRNTGLPEFYQSPSAVNPQTSGKSKWGNSRLNVVRLTRMKDVRVWKSTHVGLSEINQPRL